MRWDGRMRVVLRLSVPVLAIVILGDLPAWGQGQPAPATVNKPAAPTVAPTTKPTAPPVAAPKPVVQAPAPVPAPAPAPVPEPIAAANALVNAKAAYQQKNYQGAAEQYRNFIKTYPARPEIPTARYGLALALVAMPQVDYNAVVEALTPVEGAAFAEKPYALYYIGFGYRGQGLKEPAKAKDKFEQAAAHFRAAADGFAALPKSAATPGRTLPVEVEWTARAKCDQAEVLILAGHFKEAAAIVESMMKDGGLARSRYGKLSAFYLGWSDFGLNDFGGAGRALSTVAPFDDPAIGLHARFILGRTHQIADEAPEASAHFEAVVNGFEKVKQAAMLALKNPEAYRERPDERALLEELAKSSPEYIAEAKYQWGVCLQQQGQYSAALEKLVVFAQQNSKSPFVSDAVLRQGICRVEMKQFADAAKTLASLGEHPTLGEGAMWWLGKAHAGMADAGNPKSFEPAIATLQKAAEKARAGKEPEAKIRRGQILMDVGDTQQLAKQFKEAAATYQTLLLEKPSEELNEAALQKLSMALGMAGMYAESDKICSEFGQKYPRSPLTPLVVFRSAENAFAAKMMPEASQRYAVVVNKFPEFTQINAARKGLGTALYELKKYEEAATALGQVPSAERIGEMAGVSYLLAECLIKTMPADADDALSTARLVDQIEQAATLLNAFVVAQENHPEVPGALLKIGAMRQRAASVMADADEKRKNLLVARDAYIKVVQRFPNHPQFATAVMENARISAQTGDYPAAINQLNRFQGAPLNAQPVAPLALIQLGDYLRIQKRAAEAVALLTNVKTQHEAALLKDAARAGWVATLHYNLGMALKDSGKFAEARTELESVSTLYPNSPEALEAAWRVGESRREEAVKKLNDAHRSMTAAGGKPAETAAAQAGVDASAKLVREAADYLTAQAVKAEKNPQTRLRLMHEVALCYRFLAEAEFEMAREKLQREAGAKRQALLAADLPKGRPVPPLRAVEVALSAVAAQPSEAIAKEKYQAVVAAGADTPFAIEARVELAELLARRGDLDGAVKLLSEAVNQDGSADQIDKIRMRLAEIALVRADTKTARTQYETIAANQKSAYYHHARVGMGECYAVEKKWPQVVEIMLVYRTTPELKRLPEVADRAMLLLGQAYGQMGQWEPSRLAIDAFNRYHPNSPLMPDAKFTMSVALQNLRQLDAAVAGYRDVLGKANGELAAKAQLQMGLALMELRRFDEALDALLVVPLSYDYPDLSASALCEAARALVELKKPADATQLLNRVVKDHPTGTWADVARKRLAEIK